MSLRTEHHTIAPETPPYLIAEIGLNHNGDLSTAKRMVDAAKQSGAHAAKFQLFRSDLFINKLARLGDGPPGSLSDFFRNFELTEEQWALLRDHTRAARLDFMCSVFDSWSVSFYRDLGERVYKIASCDVNNGPLISSVLADPAAALLISTGTASEEEIGRVAEWCASHEFALLQCVSAYPASPSDYHLNVLPAWSKRYACPVGISDHCDGNEVSLAAVALGACVIERHFTLDRNMEGPDQALSLDPPRFAALAGGARRVFDALGENRRQPVEAEMGARKFGRRSLYAAQDIKAGQALTPALDVAQRPGGAGVDVERYSELIGIKAPRSYVSGEPIVAD